MQSDASNQFCTSIQFGSYIAQKKEFEKIQSN